MRGLDWLYHAGNPLGVCLHAVSGCRLRHVAHVGGSVPQPGILNRAEAHQDSIRENSLRCIQPSRKPESHGNLRGARQTSSAPRLTSAAARREVLSAYVYPHYWGSNMSIPRTNTRIGCVLSYQRPNLNREVYKLMSGETILTVIGNLTADPELRYTQNGLAVANFTVASTPRVFKDGEWKDGNTLFQRCTVWREYAENLAASLTKGSRVVVVGALEQVTWETKEGEKRSSTELQVAEAGPALRYATAQLTRKASDSQEAAAAERFRPRTPAAAGDDAWAATAPADLALV